MRIWFICVILSLFTSCYANDARFIPVLHEGRVKPLDTVARNSLLVLHGKQTFNKKPAIDWLLDTLLIPEKSLDYPVIRVDHPELLSLITDDPAHQKYVSLNEIDPHLEEIRRMAMDATQSTHKSTLENATLQLWQKITHFYQIASTIHPTNQDETPFRISLEVYFNQLQPFYYASILYCLTFVLAITSWISKPKQLLKWASLFVLIAFFIHTSGLITRMWIEGRPPVTNLYSSAIFVGWFAVLLGLLLERLYRNSFGVIVSSIIGGTTLIIAHHLAGKGDTMEMMRAVLNSNFWLSTHVVTITIGYSATFIAGFLSALSLIRSLIQKNFNLKETTSMVYGIICFATLMSFIGTVLGGIWADQSWGRFWGWDPKENGALLIVLWNAVILHARWAGIIGPRGLMQCAVFGNVVTSFSWFGVNMLGVGLHSYGFMDQAFVWLVLFAVSQLAVIGVSYRAKA